VLVAPVLPGMSDGPGMVEEVVKACVDAGAVSISSIYLHLRRGVKEHFMGWLQDSRPDLAAMYAAQYRRSSYLGKDKGAELSARVRDAIRDAGGLAPPRKGHRRGPEKPTTRKSLPAPPPEQLSFT
jgi:DNA repair photolyase